MKRHRKCKVGFFVIGLAVLSGAFIHKYLIEYKDEIDRFVRDYGRSIGEEPEKEQ